MQLALDTRNEAYRTLENVGQKQSAVYSILSRGRSMSNSEIARVLGWSINRVTPRVYELRELGFVRPSEKRICRVSGRTVQTWEAV